VSAPCAKNLQEGAENKLPGLGQGQTELPGDKRELVRVSCSSETGEVASPETKTTCQDRGQEQSCLQILSLSYLQN